MSKVGLGFIGKCGIDKATVWGTRVAPSTNDQILVDNLSLNMKPEILEDQAFNGLVLPFKGQLGTYRIEGSAGGKFRYAGLDLILLCAFGTKSAWTVSTTNESYGDFTLQHATNGDEFDSQYLSIDVLKSPTRDNSGSINSWQQFNSCAVRTLTFEYTAGQFLTWSADLMGGGASGYTKGAADPTITIDDAHQKAIALGTHVKFFTEDDGGTAMSNNDRFYPNRFRITLDNLVTPFVTAETDPYFARPFRGGTPQFTGEIEFPMLESHSGYSEPYEFLTDYEAATVKRLVMSAQYTSGSVDYAFNFIIPGLQFTDHSNWDLVTKGLIAPRFTFRAVALDTGRLSTAIWSDATYFNTTLTTAQQVPWVNVQNNRAVAP